MPVATKPHHRVLKPAGNRVVVVVAEEKRKGKKENNVKKEQKIPESVVRGNVSLDSTCSSESCSCSSKSNNASAKKVENAVNCSASGRMRSEKRKVFKAVGRVKVAPEIGGVDVANSLSPIHKASGPPKRCDWITPNTESLYTAFHDEEWGVPVDDDRKLFELLVFSQALAEHSWPAILNKRDIFRKLFENFEPSLIAQFTEKKLQTLKINGNMLLSEPKLRAIVENAKQLLKIQKEFGSLSNYCWRFVNHKPLRNEYRYGRQVPVKTSKAEVISKDMMRRGFQCVGPTVVYSFMQVAGLVNDHLITCFRYQQCNNNVTTCCTDEFKFETEVKEGKVQGQKP